MTGIDGRPGNYDGMNNGVEGEGADIVEEFGLAQQQLHTHIPGATDVQQVLPWREEQDGDTKYEQFTDGIVYRYVKNVLRKCEEKTIIRKTVKNGNVTERYHTIAYWDDRKSATYIPICQSLRKAGLKVASRLFE